MDSISGRESWNFGQYVVDCFQEAGVVDPNAGTPLTQICEDKCDAALRCLEKRHELRLRRDYSTIGEVAEQLSKAIALR